MIAIYKTNCAGPYHIKNGIPCQDSFAYAISDEGYTIASVADGLGSCKYSDVGSKVASESVVAVCKGKLKADMTQEEIIDVMKKAYMVADANVNSKAEKDGASYDEYDTTLCLAVYDGMTLYYGQAGDSGLIALTSAGEYISITSQQRDDNGAVYPLCFGVSNWVFGKVKEEISAFALMTDGILEQIFPILLKNEEVKINVSLAERMLNHFEVEDNEIPELEARMAEYWGNCPEKLIDDDKTTVCVINTDMIPMRKSEDYYKEPDWSALIDKAQKEREKIIQHSFIEKDDKDEESQDIVLNGVVSIEEQMSEVIDTVVSDIAKLAKNNIRKGVEKVKEAFKEEKLEIPLESKSMEEAIEQLYQSKQAQSFGISEDDDESKKVNSIKKDVALPMHIDVRL